MRFNSPLLQAWSLLCIVYLLMTTGIEMAAGSRRVVNFQPSVLSTDDVISYFRSFLAKASSMDVENERFYMRLEYAEDLYNEIDNLMPSGDFVRWLMKTKEITDRTSERKISLLSKYGGYLNVPCSPLSVFNQTLRKILRIWDGEKSIVTHELEEWLRLNERSQPFELCNRFRGLMCKYQVAEQPDVDQGRARGPSETSTCQCGGDPSNVGFFKQQGVSIIKKGGGGGVSSKQAASYPDGCYIRAWRPCKHLSAVDNVLRGGYEEWHGSLENRRRILAQMVFPVARTHRCKQGTYCLDMIPGMKKPVCWCNANSEDEDCKNNVKNDDGVPPLGAQLTDIRRNFAKLIIPASDMRTGCNPEYNGEVLKLVGLAGLDPTKSGAVEIMKKLGYAGKGLRICDFREAIVCDPKTRTCRGNLNCGPGKVHLGKGVCVSDNGHQCQSNEDCVQNARCTFFKEVSASACVCETGYGDECQLQHRPFFGSRFLPMVSGYQDEEYVKLQVEMFKILESWEDSMKLKVGERCDPLHDKDSMELVKYFGSLSFYEKDRGAALLVKAQKMKQGSGVGQLCRYSQFQHCDAETHKCAPFVGKGIVSTVDFQGMEKFMVEIDAEMECAPNIPKIFGEMVTLVCKKGYACEQREYLKLCVPDCNSPFAPKKDCKKEVKVEEKVEGKIEVKVEEKVEGKVEEKIEEKVKARPEGRKIQRFDYEDEDDDQPVTTTAKSNAITDATERQNNDAIKSKDTDAIKRKRPIVKSQIADAVKRKKMAAAKRLSGRTIPGSRPLHLPMGRQQSQNDTNDTTIPDNDDCEDATDEKDDCEDVIETGKFMGAPCQVRGDCAASGFLDCTTSQTHQQSNGTCLCMVGLVTSSIKPTCEIPYDEYCEEKAVEKLNVLGYNVTASPECFSGECSRVNKAAICRPVDEDGASFISKETLEKLKEKSAAAGFSSSQGKVRIITFSLVVWFSSHYPISTFNGNYII